MLRTPEFIKQEQAERGRKPSGKDFTAQRTIKDDPQQEVTAFRRSYREKDLLSQIQSTKFQHQLCSDGMDVCLSLSGL